MSTICKLLHDRMMAVILGANRDLSVLRSTLSTLFRVGLQDLHPFCFTWLGAVLDSSYPDVDKCSLAGHILLLLNDEAEEMWVGGRSKLEFFPLYATLLVRFLLLDDMCEKARIEPMDGIWEFLTFSVHPTVIALRLLQGASKDTLMLPIFLIMPPALQLRPWRQTRAVALRLFSRHSDWLFSPSVVDLLPAHRVELLRAIGDPFDLVTAPVPNNDNGLFPQVMGLLLTLASSDLWRDNLHPTNFASCDVTMAEEEHVRDTIHWFSYWRSALKGSGGCCFSGLMLGVDQLKRLRCHSAVKLILLSLWSTPIVPLYDQEVWQWVERQTLELFSARGEEHLGIFVSQIKESYGWAMIKLKSEDSEDGNGLPDAGSTFRVGGRRVRTKDQGGFETLYNFYPMCQLRRLYQLLGRDPTSYAITSAPREGIPPASPVRAPLAVERLHSESNGSERNADQTPMRMETPRPAPFISTLAHRTVPFTTVI